MGRLVIAALLAALFSPVVAAAQEAPMPRVHFFKKASSTNKHNVLESVPLNSAAASLTYEFDIGDITGGGEEGFSWSKVVLTIAYVRGAGTATHVNTVFSCSRDGGTTFSTPTTRSLALGTGKVYLHTDKNQVDGLGDDEDATAGNETYDLEFDRLTCRKGKVVISGTGAAAADLVSLQVTAAVGG